MKPKILVGCPTAHFKAYCLDAYIQGVKALQYPSFDIVLIDNSPTQDYFKRIQSHEGITVIKDEYRTGAKQRIVHSRNILRDLVLHNGYDAFFSLEQDVIPPPNALHTLLHDNKDVVSGVVFTKFFLGNEQEKRIKPLLWKAAKNSEEMHFMDTEIKNNIGLVKIKACGLGCILIKKKVLEHIPFRLNPHSSTYDDMPFCADVATHGFELYGDTRVKCKHLIEGMDWDAVDEDE